MPAALLGWLPLQLKLSFSSECQRLLSGHSLPGASAVNKSAPCLPAEATVLCNLLTDPVLTLQQAYAVLLQDC